MPNQQNQFTNQVIKYNPQLDGLRFFAVLFVVAYHWLPSISKHEMSYFFAGFVNFFFVLSSYLITKILFYAKEKSLNMNIPKFQIILVFLARRTVRIFPAYYVFLLVVIALPMLGTEVKNNEGMYFSYVANYHIFNSQVWPPMTSHIWTLAVEEQFYLVWPLSIIFIPHKYLLKTFLLIIVASVILRAVFFYHTQLISQAILTQYCIDPFAIGALLAYKYTISDHEKQTINKYFNSLLYVAIPVAIVVILMKSYYFSFVINGLIFSMVSLKLIEGAILGYKGCTQKILQNKLVLYIGKISYGIYLYHLMVPTIFWKLFDVSYAHLEYHYSVFFIRNRIGIAAFVKLLGSELGCFILYSCLAILMAILSWNLIEKPFNKLKYFFSSREQKPALTRP